MVIYVIYLFTEIIRRRCENDVNAVVRELFQHIQTIRTYDSVLVFRRQGVICLLKRMTDSIIKFASMQFLCFAVSRLYFICHRMSLLPALKCVHIRLRCNFRIAFVIIVPALAVHIVDHANRKQIKVTDRNTQSAHSGAGIMVLSLGGQSV